MSCGSEDGEEATGVPRFLDDVQRVDRKRVRLDSAGRKRWSLTDKQSDQEVLLEMGVGILDPDDPDVLEVASCSHASMIKPSPKRKRDIENVSPNVIRSPAGAVGAGTAAGARSSPRRARRSPAAGRRSPPSAERAGCELQSRAATEAAELERSTHACLEPLDEETPLPLLPASGLHRMGGGGGGGGGGCTSPGPYSSGSEWPASSGSSRRIPSSCSGIHSPYTQDEERLQEDAAADGGREPEDAFAAVSDEVVLSVFKWLPKQSLVLCTLVCRRWHRVASDESLWQRLELGGRALARGALGKVLAKKPLVVRLASSEVGDWRSPADATPARLQYLDLSMCVIERDTLNALLGCCPALRKLSLETVEVDDVTCSHIGNCERLETLNLTMCNTITPEGMLSIVRGCSGLKSLNVSWCKMSALTLVQFCSNAPSRLQRLNIAGSRNLSDDMVAELVQRCPQLLELDLSDSSRLTETTISSVARLSRLEHLALSRCYQMDLHSLTRVSTVPALQYLEVWGTLQPAALATLRSALPTLSINQFMHSAIARPTVGVRRTSIWGLRTRD